MISSRVKMYVYIYVCAWAYVVLDADMMTYEGLSPEMCPQTMYLERHHISGKLGVMPSDTAATMDLVKVKPIVTECTNIDTSVKRPVQ